MSRILGIDPGLSNCGFAIIAGDKLLDHGCIHNSKFDMAAKELHELIYNPFITLIAIEDYVYFGAVKGKAAISTPQVIGIIRGIAIAHGIEVIVLTPVEWRKALTGTNAPSDDQIRKWVEQELHYKFPPQKKYQHEIEAAGIAYVAERRAK